MSNVTLSEGTKIPLKTVIPVVLAVASVGFWLTSGMSAIAHQVEIQAVHSEHTREEVAEMKAAVNALGVEVKNDIWRRAEMSRWVSRLRAENPTIKIPEIE